MIDFDTRLQYLKGIGEARSKQFAGMGLYSVGGLLRFYPARYEDWSKTVSIAAAPVDELCSIRATVMCAPVESRTKNNTKLYKTSVTDGTDMLNITFFHNKYVMTQLEKDAEYIFFGKLTRNYFGSIEMLSPDFTKAQGGERIRPIYRQSGKLTTKTIERSVASALREMAGRIEDTIPPELLRKYRMPTLEQALNSIHFPPNDEALYAARRRLIFEELLVLQTGLLSLKTAACKRKSPALKRDYSSEFLKMLPFEPTGAQKRAVAEAAENMSRPSQMNRLLSGDVGSGKTAVAAALMYSAVKNGLQCALMAPTEVLAAQHKATLTKLLENTGITVELLTGSVTAKEKKRIKAELADGKCDIVVGTHAIIQKDVAFLRLGFVVTDEQHRFGVEQRAALGEKGHNPHVLVMSATPIPRTLAMIVYGELDISVLDEMPKGRIPVKTYCVTESYHSRVFDFVKSHLDKRQQGFIICPLVEESESQLIPATQYYEYLRDTYFRGYRLGLLHGQMKSSEKDRIMTEFSAGNIDLLVSTVVIEVGIDVPNATVMVIENAERFGLSQLHQLRGRIGRGTEQSSCILISDAQNQEAHERFDILCKTNNGFEIADKDLELRGPGDFFGSRQHGLPELNIANLMTDTRALTEAGKVAREILAEDPELTSEKFAPLAREVGRLFTNYN